MARPNNETRERQQSLLDAGLKECSACKKLKPLDGFGYFKGGVGDLRATCKPCTNARSIERYNPHRIRWQYGLTREEFNQRVINQQGLCSVCQASFNHSKREPVIDHDHTAQQVRDLLCNRCNRGLGFFADDPQLLEAAAAYLRRHQGS